jgi:hypothetical protein
MNRKIDLATAAQVLDVTVSAVLRASGDRSRTLISNLCPDGLVRRGAGVGVLWERREGDIAIELVGLDELALALVPGCKDLG